MFPAEIGTKWTASVRRPAVADRQHSREKDAVYLVPPLHGHFFVRTIVASACSAVQSGSNEEAGMMNLQRLSPVPAPLLRSVILATGIVGLLAVSEPEGIQHANAMPGKDIKRAL